MVGPTINNCTPWMLTRDTEYKETNKKIEGQKPFYLFVYITMSRESLKDTTDAHIFISFEFFSGELVEQHLDLKKCSIREANDFINLNGINIGDKVVEVIKYTFDPTVQDFNAKIIYNDTETLAIVKSVVDFAKRDNLLDHIHTVVYKPIIDVRI